MPRLRSIFIALLACGVGAAAGAWVGMGQRSASFRAALDETMRHSRDAAREPSRPRRTTAAVETEELVTQIMSACLHENPLKRAHEFRRALASVDSAQLAVLFGRALKVGDSAKRRLVLTAVLQAWGEVDETAAAAVVRPYLDAYLRSTTALWQSPEEDVVEAWAEVMPEAMMREALASSSPKAARLGYIALSHMAGGDAIRQVEVLIRLPAGPQRERLMAPAIRAVAAQEGLAAERFLTEVSDQRVRAALQADIMEKAALRDPASALARFRELAPTFTFNLSGLTTVTSFFLTTGRLDPERALGAVDALPEDLRATATGSALVGWAHVDPVAALEWAAAHGVDVNQARAVSNISDNSGGSWQPLLSAAGSADGDKTIAWILRQPAGRERDDMLGTQLWSNRGDHVLEAYAAMTPEAQADNAGAVARHLYSDSPGKAEAWVAALPPGESRADAVRQFTAIAVQNISADEANTLLDKWPAPADRNAALGAVAAARMRADPPAAIALAAQISNPGARETSMIQLGRSWLWQDAPAACDWITHSAPIREDFKRVILRQFDER